MGTKTKKTPSEQLQLLGKWQLISFFVILLWLAVVDSLAIAVRNPGADWGHGGFAVLWMFFGVFGLLLIPSAIAFIRVGKDSKFLTVQRGKIGQIILFASNLLLIYPSYYVAETTLRNAMGLGDPGESSAFDIFSHLLGPTFFVACILGILFFPFMLRFTSDFKKSDEAKVNLDLIKQ